MTMVIPERRLALIHRVIVPDRGYPKEYAILVTDRRSVFIRQEKTRRSFVLRQEMRIGTALVTDVLPKTLEDYQQSTIDDLTNDSANQTVWHDRVISFAMTSDPLEFRRRDFFVRMVMKLQKEMFQVYNFEVRYERDQDHDAAVKFYAVPLGAYFKPRRQTETREMILREYAIDVNETFRRVLPDKIAGEPEPNTISHSLERPFPVKVML